MEYLHSAVFFHYWHLKTFSFTLNFSSSRTLHNFGLQVLANRFPLGGSRGLRWSALIPIMLGSLYFLTFLSLSPFLFCFTEKVTDRLQWRSAQWAPRGWWEFLGEPGRMLISKARWVAGGWRRSRAHWALKLLLNSISGNSCGSDTV